MLISREAQKYDLKMTSQDLLNPLLLQFFASLEYWAFEILVFLAGLMQNSEVTTSLIAMW